MPRSVAGSKIHPTAQTLCIMYASSPCFDRQTCRSWCWLGLRAQSPCSQSEPDYRFDRWYVKMLPSVYVKQSQHVMKFKGDYSTLIYPPKSRNSCENRVKYAVINLKVSYSNSIHWVSHKTHRFHAFNAVSEWCRNLVGLYRRYKALAPKLDKMKLEEDQANSI